MLDDLTQHLSRPGGNKSQLMYDLAGCIAAAIDANSFNLYLHEKQGQISQYAPYDDTMKWVFYSLNGWFL